MVNDSGEEVYKSSQKGGQAAYSHALAQVQHAQDEALPELREEIAKFKDPVVVGALMYRSVRERESANLMLQKILARLDAMEQKISAMEQNHAARQPQTAATEGGAVMIPDVDREIVNFVQEKGHVCADDVQDKFGYKGRNAASARLNRLCELSLLEKQQVGRKVYFRPKMRS
ncbi:MAG TPA: hypothetical protein PLO51_00185 [Candidatus Micrarchaeota archaeon]|nr:hypothetical protein [Candidatus Micrarchaeota archaeon]